LSKILKIVESKVSDNLNENQEEIYSKVLRAGRRTYFFDVRETKASDYYLTITESKKFTNDDGSFYYKKHKIYVYKEDFENFSAFLNETMNFIFEQRGVEVISERHQKNYIPNNINTQS
tara:strand:+ start:3402 stop:3758 length:357 start_codon:yes stop_codon:yes gene_type:complete